MKKIMIVILGFAIVSLYFSCDEDNNVLPTPKQKAELLIEQIVTAPTVEAVGVRDLPGSISNYVQSNHVPLEIDLAFHASPHGYEVFLENGLCLYFDENGDHLNHDNMHGDMGNHHGGGDPGINFCLAGDTLNASALPQTIIDHIATNYSGASVITVVIKPSGNLAVEISTGDILMFGPSGNYYHACDMQGTGGHGHGHGNVGYSGWHCDPADPENHSNPGGMMGGHHGSGHSSDDWVGPCWGGTGIPVADLLPNITNYVDTNHPGVIVEFAVQTFSNNYFLRLSDCVRLVFDESGNILFDSGG